MKAMISFIFRDMISKLIAQYIIFLREDSFENFVFQSPDDVLHNFEKWLYESMKD